MARPRTKETKQEALKRLGIVLKVCVQCGVTGAMWRFYTDTELCNECAKPLSIKYLQTLEKVVILGFIITYFL